MSASPATDSRQPVERRIESHSSTRAVRHGFDPSARRDRPQTDELIVRSLARSLAGKCAANSPAAVIGGGGGKATSANTIAARLRCRSGGKSVCKQIILLSETADSEFVYSVLRLLRRVRKRASRNAGLQRPMLHEHTVGSFFCSAVAVAAAADANSHLYLCTKPLRL